MTSRIQNVPSQTTDYYWAPSTWDMFGNATLVTDGLKRKADVRNNFSTHELGSDAGRFVLDQYLAAKGETGKATVIQSAISVGNLRSYIAKIMPLIGMVAALGVDYAIYGAASEGLGTAHLPFNLNAFGIGSLIFAGALGIAENYKRLLLLATVIATLGASFIAADQNELRKSFTHSLTSAFEAGGDSEYVAMESLKSEISTLQQMLSNNTIKLQKGGRPGSGNNGTLVPMPMKGDGTKGNDEEADSLISDNRKLEKDIKNKSVELAAAKPAFYLAKRKDPLDLVGRLLAALYTGAWLIGAQLLVSEIVRTSFHSYKMSREKIADRNRQKVFFSQLEDPDENIRKNTTRAAVEATLSRFSEILSMSEVDSKYPAKHENFAKLFEEDSYKKIVTAATEVVVSGIVPRR